MKINYFTIGAFSATLAIALGAFGAHGLEGKITEHYIQVFETGVRYHMYSSLGLMLIGLLSKIVANNKSFINGAHFILAGTIIFSGSLYILSLTSFSKLGMITPIGGVAMIIGWCMVAISAGKQKFN
ncbi:DUF423 domain-containing protein [Paenibacillus yanchengensis]|uniref:DUF423 domain-containing protein n=1 Tax=Paenibacillus yanchengensis TaxID=2035833 RepID=A0ABW4YMY8_9BACL